MRTETFSIFQSRSQARRFRINWRGPAGGWLRYKVWADSVEDAAAQAPDVMAGRDPNRREEPTVYDQDLLVVEAFERALAASKRGLRSRKDWNSTQTRFIEWLAKNHPEATHWGKITRPMLREYIVQTLPADAGDNYVRLTMQPVIQTAGYMECEYERPNPARRLKIGNKLKKTPPMVFLADVMALLDWMVKHEPRLEAGAALQGLAGLQLQEALRLTWDKVDLKRGWIEISGEVKNTYRTRVIPVANRVLEALRRADEHRRAAKVQTLGPQPVVVSPDGVAFAGSSWKNWSHRLKAAIVRWNDKVEWAPKDLRNCLLTFFALQGIAGDLTEQYIGHVPKTVTGRHYVPRLAAATAGEREKLEEMMNQFRRIAVESVEQEMGKIARKSHDEAKQGQSGKVLELSKSN